MSPLVAKFDTDPMTPRRPNGLVEKFATANDAPLPDTLDDPAGTFTSVLTPDTYIFEGLPVVPIFTYERNASTFVFDADALPVRTALLRM